MEDYLNEKIIKFMKLKEAKLIVNDKELVSKVKTKDEFEIKIDNRKYKITKNKNLKHNSEEGVLFKIYLEVIVGEDLCIYNGLFLNRKGNLIEIYISKNDFFDDDYEIYQRPFSLMMYDMEFNYLSDYDFSKEMARKFIGENIYKSFVEEFLENNNLKIINLIKNII